MYKSFWRYIKEKDHTKIIYSDKYADVLIEKYTKDKYILDDLQIFNTNKLPDLIDIKKYERVICESDKVGLSADDLLKEIAVNTFFK